ncbi:hypothetical protein D3C77_124680 [compost metagenome]
MIDGVELVRLMLDSGDFPLVHRFRFNGLHPEAHHRQVSAFNRPGTLCLGQLRIVSHNRDCASGDRFDDTSFSLAARQVDDQAIFRLHLGINVERDYSLGGGADAATIRAP